jgi:hypothetical protein
MRLTLLQKVEIEKKLNAGVPVADLAAEYKVTKPVIYNLKSKRSPTLTAASLLEQEIVDAELRIVELQKTVLEIDSLQQVVKVKKAVLESLKKLAK